VFVPPEYYLSPTLEKAEYDLHQNEVGDPGYRRFLSRLGSPLLQRLPIAARGLDFGCGPGPALAAMLGEAGHEVALYDVFYQADTSVLASSYQFITATEVVEHLHRPGEELARLWLMIEPGGYLGIMTKLARNAQAFAAWHYKNDPTHVCFFTEETWRWWADQANADLERIDADVMLLHKS
jgi:2-polyprenyl-3-methyl-5-hydroxy-6-metoxy-1,4-benzoquinol methylase